jgi:TolB-like protein/Tfp pilus assembly protein PilF
VDVQAGSPDDHVESPDLLDSWKAIAAYLNRDLRTVQRWEEREAMPVHRHLHGKLGSVFAYRSEIDAWKTGREKQAKEVSETPPDPSAASHQPVVATAVLSPVAGTNAKKYAVYLPAIALLCALAVGGAMLWRRPRKVMPAVVSSRAIAVAVLPFENLSAGQTEDRVADGLTDDIITDLGRIGQFAVISRTSVMEFKGAREPLPKTALSLHANLIVEGTLVRAGNRVRITAQLIDAASDHHIWADSYERDYKDVLSLQDDVAGDIAAAVSEKLSGHVTVRRPVSPANPEARVNYLIGRFFWNRRDESSLKQAINYFDAAIAKDPGYAAAYSGLADCYNLLSVWGSLTPNRSFPEARKDALKAIELEPDSAEAYTSLAFETYRYEWDFIGAEKDFRKAIALNPNYVTAHQWYGEFLGDIRRFDQGSAELRKAQQLDPLSAIVGCDLASCYIHSGRYAEAVTILQEILTRQPDYAVAHNYLASVYDYEGEYAEAEKEHGLYVRLSGDIGEGEANRIKREWITGKKKQAKREMETLLANTKEGRFGYVQMALMYTSVGDRDKAFTCLDKAYQQHSWWLVTIEVEPNFASLRNDPRFKELERRIGIPE